MLSYSLNISMVSILIFQHNKGLMIFREGGLRLNACNKHRHCRATLYLMLHLKNICFKCLGEFLHEVLRADSFLFQGILPLSGLSLQVVSFNSDSSHSPHMFEISGGSTNKFSSELEHIVMLRGWINLCLLHIQVQ